MGTPLRFLGTGTPAQLDGTTLPGRFAVEVTFRCHQQRHLLRPDRIANEIVLGCLARAYQRYPSLNLAVVSALSNHGCFVALPDSTHTLSSFMRDFLSSLAVRMNRHRGRDGTFWECRYRAIPIVDREALEDRFRYVLTQGTKEDLVAHATEWPGVSSIPALMGGPPLIGRWRDRTAEYELHRARARRMARARQRGLRIQPPRVRPIWREYPIHLVPLPHWEELPVGKRRAIVASIVKQDASDTAARHSRDGTSALGRARILRVDPLARPNAPKRSNAPCCHAGTAATRRAFRRLYSTYVASVRTDRQRAMAAIPRHLFPIEATLPPMYCGSAGGRQRRSRTDAARCCVPERVSTTGPPPTTR